MKKYIPLLILFLTGCSIQPQVQQAQNSFNDTKTNITNQAASQINNAKTTIENAKNQAISWVNNAITTTTNTLADTINWTINTQVDQKAQEIKNATSWKVTSVLPAQNCDSQLENMKLQAKKYYENENIVVQGYYFSKSLQTCNYVARVNFWNIWEIWLFDLRKNTKLWAVSSLWINDLLKVSTRSCFDITRKFECENFWKVVDSYK